MSPQTKNTRLETPFGNDGFSEPRGRLKPFSALHRFDGRTFGLTVWAATSDEAIEYCFQHGLRFDGEILQRYHNNEI